MILPSFKAVRTERVAVAAGKGWILLDFVADQAKEVLIHGLLDKDAGVESHC